jgi:hypothetical protein
VVTIACWWSSPNSGLLKPDRDARPGRRSTPRREKQRLIERAGRPPAGADSAPDAFNHVARDATLGKLRTHGATGEAVMDGDSAFALTA